MNLAWAGGQRKKRVYLTMVTAPSSSFSRPFYLRPFAFFNQHIPLQSNLLQASTMSGPNYRRVAQRDGISHSGSSDNLEANITRSLGERLTDKLVARELLHCIFVEGAMRSTLSFGKYLYITLTYYTPFESFHSFSCLGCSRTLGRSMDTFLFDTLEWKQTQSKSASHRLCGGGNQYRACLVLGGILAKSQETK